MRSARPNVARRAIDGRGHSCYQKFERTIGGAMKVPIEICCALPHGWGGTCCEHGRCATTAESCTGGWIAKALTDVPGSSQWFGEGFVTYSNEAKMRRLGVPRAILAREGAVSAARGARHGAGRAAPHGRARGGGRHRHRGSGWRGARKAGGDSVVLLGAEARPARAVSASSASAFAATARPCGARPYAGRWRGCCAAEPSERARCDCSSPRFPTARRAAGSHAAAPALAPGRCTAGALRELPYDARIRRRGVQRAGRRADGRRRGAARRPRSRSLRCLRVLAQIRSRRG